MRLCPLPVVAFFAVLFRRPLLFFWRHDLRDDENGAPFVRPLSVTFGAVWSQGCYRFEASGAHPAGLLVSLLAEHSSCPADGRDNRF